MTTKKQDVVCCLFACLLAAAGVDQLKAWSFQGLGDLPGDRFESSAAGVSADGLVVVGWSRSALGREAFRWTADGGMVGLGYLPKAGRFQETWATRVSADGSVVVGVGSILEEWEAFRWTAESGMVGLGDLPLGMDWSQAKDVSADGSVVVGQGSSEWGNEAFLWTADGGMVGLGDLPGGQHASRAEAVSGDGSVLVGFSHSASGPEAFRSTVGDGMVGLGDLLGGGFESHAYDISSDGSTVVGVSAREAFLWTSEGGVVGLGDLPGGPLGSLAWAVSADGSVVVGDAKPWHSDSVPFIWDPTNGMRNLKEVLSVDYGLDLTGWELTRATDVSDDGLVIVGYGLNPAGHREAWRAVIPEPPTLLLAVSGLLALLRWVWRKRQHILRALR